ncbi:mrna cleavage factor complex component pcf11 [Ophiostoma piceae UAMH 11346]|uniref:Mrna cleavage factor complex component pcf11 n=1 Tax=Ophiostoma piceae (strain UAMH 11346) TaxID=1262450 RepID=S3CQC2_OPHP1|nr:mrna cleavage factor complex component pcf11 [Ophiostoma piceae UAMH 11346]
MTYEDHSEDVAADFRDALEGLTGNNRVEITTLTVIARENTEYAHGISEVLQEHIKKVTPARKLPALYLLDSIVKNVGTPYTIYFSRGLYATFMNAYASVDNATRRKMDEMLKTWKEPVPGSVDPRPVFTLETVRPIENALMKVRSTTLQAQHEHLRSEQQLLSRSRPQSNTPYRETPTPPGGRPGYPPQGPHGQQPPQQAYPIHPGQQQTTQTTPQPPIHATAGGPFQPPAPQLQHNQAPGSRVTSEALTEDVERLIQATKAERAEKAYDSSVAARLEALLNLQTILRSQNLEYDKLVLVRKQIDALAVNLPPHLRAQAGLTPTPPVSGYPFQPPPQQQRASSQQPQQQQPPQLSAAIMAALAAAQAKQAGQPAATPTPPPPQVPQLQQALLAASRLAGGLSPAPGNANATPGGPANPMALMEMLKKAGILPQGAAGQPAPQIPVPQAPPGLNIQGLAGIIASIQSPAFGVREPLREISNEVTFSAASLKQFRPHLLPLLYDDLGPPCTQCGRRFRTDDAGRAAKTAHMDWHFRVHQRIVEAERRGQHRSWYVDQADWVQSRETADSDGSGHAGDGHGSGASGVAGGRATGGSGAAAGSGNGAAGAKLQWIPVPTGNTSTNQICPICQEKFELKWLDEAQEWVWIDAIKVGPRVYHASCHAEATRSGNNRETPAAAAMSAMMSGGGGHLPGVSVPIPTGPAADRNRYQSHGRNTPEPVLGKRKAEDNFNNRGNGGKNGARGGHNHAGTAGNGVASGTGGAAGAAGRKKKRGGLGGPGGIRRPPDLDRVDPDIGGGAGTGDGAGSGRSYGRNGGKMRGGGNDDSEDAKVDLNALPY